MDAKTKKELERLRHENAIMWERKGDERKSFETISRLRKELRDTRKKLAEHEESLVALIKTYGNMAAADRVIEWINNPKRQPAITAFTDGAERQIAYAVERLIS